MKGNLQQIKKENVYVYVGFDHEREIRNDRYIDELLDKENFCRLSDYIRNTIETYLSLELIPEKGDQIRIIVDLQKTGIKLTGNKSKMMLETEIHTITFSLNIGGKPEIKFNLKITGIDFIGIDD